MTDPQPPAPLSTGQATHLFVPDLGWVPITPGSLLIAEQPVFVNAITGKAFGVPGLWVQFTGTDGTTYGFFAAPGQPWLQWAPQPQQGQAAMDGEGTATAEGSTA